MSVQRNLTANFWPNRNDAKPSYRDIFSSESESPPTPNTPPICIRACEKCALLRSRMHKEIAGSGPCSCLDTETIREGYKLELSEIDKGSGSGFQRYLHDVKLQLEANPDLLIKCYFDQVASSEHQSLLLSSNSEESEAKKSDSEWKNFFIEVSIKIVAFEDLNKGGLQEGNIKVEKVQWLKRDDCHIIEEWREEHRNRTIGFTIKIEVVYPIIRVHFWVRMELPLTEEEERRLREYEEHPSSMPVLRPTEDPSDTEPWKDRICRALSDPRSDS